MSAFARFDALMGRFYHFVGNLVGISIGLFAVAISLDLFLRLFEVGNLAGVQEIIEYALFAGVFLAAPWVLRLGAHIKVDLLIAGAPPIVGRVLDGLGLAICLVLLRYGWMNLSQAYRFNSMQMKYFQVPEWWLLAVYMVAFSLLALEFLCRILRGGDASEAVGDSQGGV